MANYDNQTDPITSIAWGSVFEALNGRGLVRDGSPGSSYMLKALTSIVVNGDQRGSSKWGSEG